MRLQSCLLFSCLAFARLTRAAADPIQERPCAPRLNELINKVAENHFGYPASTLHKNVLKEGNNWTGILPDVPTDRNGTELLAFAARQVKGQK